MAEMSKANLSERLWCFVEHPILVAAIAVILGVIGLFVYTPILWLCGGLFVVAFYRAKVVAGYSWKVQIAAYAVLCLCIALSLYFINLFVERKEAASKKAELSTTLPAQLTHDLKSVQPVAVTGASRHAAHSTVAPMQPTRQAPTAEEIAAAVAARLSPDKPSLGNIRQRLIELSEELRVFLTGRETSFQYFLSKSTNMDSPTRQKMQHDHYLNLAETYLRQYHPRVLALQAECARYNFRNSGLDQMVDIINQEGPQIVNGGGINGIRGDLLDLAKSLSER